MAFLQRFLPLICAAVITTSFASRPACPRQCVCPVLHLVHEVKCVGAGLTSIPAGVPSKANTTIMDLSMNKIQTISYNSLANFESLRVLALKNNEIKEINRNAFRSIQELTILDLSFNNISHMNENIFEFNPKLELLVLSHNPLYLPANGLFLISKSLKVINLASAELTSIPADTFNRLESLSTLNLSNNLLKHLTEKSLDLLKSLKTVDLKGNPLRCDCDLKAMWNWSRQLGGVEIVDALCEEPEASRGYSWDRLKDLPCEPQAFDYTAVGLSVIVAVLVVIMALVLAVLVFLYRRRKKRGHGLKPPRDRMLPAPPGEYIVVLPDVKADPVYEKIGDRSRKELERGEEAQRYVTTQYAPARAASPPQPTPTPRPMSAPTPDMTPASAGGYLAPADVRDGPIYANLRGPPLPIRRPDSGPSPPPAENDAPDAADADDASPPPSPAPRLVRPCSIPLLQGCDFYEVVE